jgi:acetyl-CoA carboxylase biotin carboxyl carrier protein
MSETATEEPDSIPGVEVLSPMPGTFYRAPSPDDPPFVKEGDSVKKGDPLCIIEAMKIMNEIEAEDNGVIQKIFIESGQAVEFNQPLFIIEPN